MSIDGYMCSVSWDGQVLTIVPSNKAAAVALLGPEFPERAKGDWSVRLTEWDALRFNFPPAAANWLVNGSMTVEAGGRKYVAHFRRKHNDGFRGLVETLEQMRAHEYD